MPGTLSAATDANACWEWLRTVSLPCLAQYTMASPSPSSGYLIICQIELSEYKRKDGYEEHELRDIIGHSLPHVDHYLPIPAIGCLPGMKGIWVPEQWVLDRMQELNWKDELVQKHYEIQPYILSTFMVSLLHQISCSIEKVDPESGSFSFEGLEELCVKLHQQHTKPPPQEHSQIETQETTLNSESEIDSSNADERFIPHIDDLQFYLPHVSVNLRGVRFFEMAPYPLLLQADPVRKIAVQVVQFHPSTSLLEKIEQRFDIEDANKEQSFQLHDFEKRMKNITKHVQKSMKLIWTARLYPRPISSY
ncbi:MAG: hypothetical protein Sylvanvirus2_3 [Sylvanvirus sp.]|uniref:Uncharacterized protein n=1 Tax=Sylvanvirus sp. TaxID=2487774 RepID=A0A3G5AH38_9VIRU|nr:MAG: hypothetical protein Sylvanvirus2_3 [Sylvanvirus sp.]